MHTKWISFDVTGTGTGSVLRVLITYCVIADSSRAGLVIWGPGEALVRQPENCVVEAGTAIKNTAWLLQRGYG